MYLKVFYSLTPTCPVVVGVDEVEENRGRIVYVEKGTMVVRRGPVRVYDPSGRLVGVFPVGRYGMRPGVYFVLYGRGAMKVLVP